MKALIRDLETFASVKPLELTSYLRTRGWHQSELDVDRYAVWTGGPGNQFEVLVPLNSQLRDFALRISSTLKTLADAEERSQLEIFREIVTASSDLIRIGAIETDFRDGSMPLQAGVSLVERSRDVFLSAACSAHQKRSVFYSRKPSAAVEYMQRVRLGQTENGSFVVTMYAPVPPSLEGSSDEPEPIPYERRVTSTLMTAAQALNGAAQAAAALGSVAPFEDAVASGVSANLCDALVSLFDDTRCDRLELSVNWAAVRPCVGTSHPPRSVTLRRDIRPLLEEAARTFRHRHPEAGAELIGYIVKLNRAESATYGELTIVGKTSVGVRHVRAVQVQSADYEIAVNAHRDEQAVRIVGDLKKDGRSWVLEHPRDIAIIAADES